MIGTKVAIFSGAGSKLCLAVDPYDQFRIIVDIYYPGDPRMEWFRIDNGNGTVGFWQVAAGGMLGMGDADGNLVLRTVTPQAGTIYGSNEAWTVVEASPPHVNWWTVVAAPFVGGLTLPFVLDPGHFGYAIRPNLDSDRNLNILGNGPYGPISTVAAWHGWGGGEPNEIWVVGPI